MEKSTEISIMSPFIPPAQKRAAFTLVELLVVIAVTSILGAVLLPVFSQAREKARSANCLSNLKQNALGMMEYTQDNDERVPIVQYCSQGVQTKTCSGHDSSIRTWVNAIQPYTKSLSILHCPDDPKNPFGKVLPPDAQSTAPYLYPSYGLNVTYLNPSRNCAALAEPDGPWGLPIGLADLEAPGSTVMFADVKVLGSDGAGYRNSLSVEAPATAGPSSSSCTYSDGGWGQGSFGDDPGIPDNPATGTGNFSPRHAQGGNVVFCDGHTKWYLPARLAAGTDWTPSSLNYAIKITDLSQYLWSARKSGTSDL